MKVKHYLITIVAVVKDFQEQWKFKKNCKSEITFIINILVKVKNM